MLARLVSAWRLLRRSCSRPAREAAREQLLARLHLLHRLTVPWSATAPPPPKRFGRYGERVAVSWLRAQGHRILRCDWRWGRRGELDIVSRCGDMLVFTEVKSALGMAGGAAARHVNRPKRELIRHGARNWLRLLNREVPYRFDIVEVYLPAGQRPQVEHHPHAFTMHEGHTWQENSAASARA